MEKAQIQFLFQFLFIQIQTLENIKNKIEKVRPISEDKTNSLAYLIHNYYSCIEDVFKEIEKVFEEGGRFSTDSFHKDLLLHAKFELKGIRPRIISDNSYLILFDILKFRHLFRHAYNYVLNPARVRENKILVMENHLQLIEEFKLFNLICFCKAFLKSNSLVSVIMPLFNAEKYAREAIGSQFCVPQNTMGQT